MRRRRRSSHVAPLVAVVVVILVLSGVVAALVAGAEEERADPARSTPTPRHTASPAPARPPRLVRRVVGRGAGAATIVRQDAPGALPGVLFLHGWGYQRPRDYRAWIRHLARRGNVVIVPRYQRDARSDPATVRRAMLAGVRRALAKADVDSEGFVAAGHSAGGALAADYAAVADGAGLPTPRALFVAYPGRAIIGTPGIPAADLSRIPAATRMLVMAGTTDTVVGTAPARATFDGALAIPPGRKRLLLVRDRRVADHLAPLRTGPAARRAFWRRLDRLIARARGR